MKNLRPAALVLGLCLSAAANLLNALAVRLEQNEQ